MKHIVAFMVIVILLIMIIIGYTQDNYFEKDKSKFRVEENKVGFTLFFCGLKWEFSLNLYYN